MFFFNTRKKKLKLNSIKVEPFLFLLLMLSNC